jgi:hypothetical protein
VTGGFRVSGFRFRRRRERAIPTTPSRLRIALQNGTSSLVECLAWFWDSAWGRLLRLLLPDGGRLQGRRGVMRLRGPARVAAEEMERIEELLSLQDALGDWKALSGLGDRSREADSTFHLEPEAVMALCRRLLELNLPFLDLGGVVAEGAAGERVEVVERMTPAIVHETTTILCPEVTTTESRWRDGELSYRPADALSDLFRLPLHERALPPALLMDLLLKGELFVPGKAHRPRLEFIPQEVLLPVLRLVPTPIVFHLPQSDSSEQKRIVYFLIDTSQSMRGPLAVLSAAIVRAVLLAGLGHPRVYFARAFGEDVDPPADLPPRQARETEERLELADWVMGENFGGSETRLMFALMTCLEDIQHAREQPGQEELHAAEVILISDGRSTVLPYVQDEVRRSGVQLHVVSLGSHRNSDLEAVAGTFTVIADAQNLEAGWFAAPNALRLTPEVGRQPVVSPGA